MIQQQQQHQFIDFANMTGFIREMVLSAIDDSLVISGKYHGRVIGGYVRDVIVPRLFDPNCDISFKDVNIWFRTQNDADSFVKEAGLISNTDIDPSVVYPFIYQKYYLYRHGTCIAFVDVIISETIPVNDFHINKLVYFYQRD